MVGKRSNAEFYLTKGLNQQFTEKRFSTMNSTHIKFGDVRTTADLFAYLEHHFIKCIYWESYYAIDPPEDENAMNILGENKVLGVPRIRQVRMANDSCVVHEYFQHLFRTCFDEYEMDREDHSAFGLAEPGWVYSDESITKSLPHDGEISTYLGGGYYIDLPKTKNETASILNTLRRTNWISRETRAVFIDFSTYNANLNLFAVCKLIFEFPTAGGIIPNCKIHSMKLIRFNYSYDYFVLAFECVYYCFIIFYILEGVRDILYFKWKLLRKFWTYIDLIIIVCALLGAFYSMLEMIKIEPTIKHINEHPDQYGNLEYLTELYLLNNTVAAVNLFFIYIKAFKYLNFNKIMGQLNNTLSRCAWDILCFSFMFFVIFFAFAELGYLLFGSQVEDFSSFGIAMFTLLRTILGDFEYEELERANPLLAPIYFVSYIFLVFFVLLNMFLAIINDTYTDVKTEIAIAPDETQLLEYLRKRFTNLLKKCGCFKKPISTAKDKPEVNVILNQIRDGLRKCGFSELEIEMFFARYNIHPTADINVKNIDRLNEDLQKTLDESGAMSDRYVLIDEFAAQQKKLDEIDMKIAVLVDNVKNLLKKLSQMENVRKTAPDD